MKKCTLLFAFFIGLSTLFFAQPPTATTKDSTITPAYLPDCANHNRPDWCTQQKIQKIVYQNLELPSNLADLKDDKFFSFQYKIDTIGKMVELKLSGSPGSIRRKKIAYNGPEEVKKALTHLPNFVPAQKDGQAILSDIHYLGISVKRDSFFHQRMVNWQGIEQRPQLPDSLGGDTLANLRSYLGQFIYKHFKMPALAKSKAIEDYVALSLEFDQNGNVSNLFMYHDPGYGCAEAVKEILLQLPTMEPARLGNKAVVSRRIRVSTNITQDPYFYEKQINKSLPRKADPSVPPKAFKKVVEMPRFPGCETEKNLAKRKRCAADKMIRFIYGNLKYPPAARAKKIEGTIVIRFIVQPDGSLSDLELVRDIGYGTGEEGMRVVKSMPRWIPGKAEGGEAVKVYFNLPIKYRLN